MAINDEKLLLVLGGATATGKTTTAINLALAFETEILSADSRQFYKEMSIGTAKPSPSEQQGIRHHFIDSLHITQDYSVGDFERDALTVLSKIYQQHRIAIITGGSGLYLQAVCAGLDTFPPVSSETKDWVTAGVQNGGLLWLQEQVAQLDPGYYQTVDRQNPARLRRALEVCRESGVPYSSFLAREKPERPFRPVYMLLDMPRAELYARIDARVDGMVAAGLEEEARRLLPFRERPALRTVGYEEWFDFFDGKMGREETIQKIKQHTRNYAKRQATWFGKHGNWAVFHPTNQAEILNFCRQQVSES